MFKLTLALAISATLAACGGGGGSDQPSNNVPRGTIQPATRKPIVIAFYGDSTTEGRQTNNGQLSTTSKTEPIQISTLFQQWYPNSTIVVENHGIGGTEASQILQGTGGYGRTFDQEMAQSDANVVVLNFALNDSYYPSVPAQANIIQETPDMYWGYMANLCQIVRNHGKVCVFEEPNPINGIQDPNAPLYGYVNILRQVAMQMNAPLIPQFDAMQRADANWLRDYISEDGVHPTDSGYGYKAVNSYNVLSTIVKGL